MPRILGLDIGGANLKGAHSDGLAHAIRFPLWKDPSGLEREVRHLLERFPPYERLAITMTGELCDCFADQAEGARFILKAVRKVTPVPMRVWNLQGGFFSFQEAMENPRWVAAANWLAQATLAARLIPRGSGLLIDIGSTTTDIVPLREGRPVPAALADPERMACGELIYTGARRTPLCAVLGSEVAAELFATMADVYLVLGDLEPAAADRDTADGKPFTPPFARARLARMRCADPASCSEADSVRLAERARARQVDLLVRSIRGCLNRLAEPKTILLSGSGAFLRRYLQPRLKIDTWLSLAEVWGREQAIAACAWAVAVLASPGPG